MKKGLLVPYACGGICAAVLLLLTVLLSAVRGEAVIDDQTSDTTNASDAPNAVYLYANEFTLPDLAMRAAKPTIEAVAEAVKPRPLVVRTVSIDELDQAIVAKKADIVIAGAAIYRRHVQNGMRDIATLVTDLQPNPDHAVGALIVSRADSGISSLEDLRGKRLGINHPLGFQCWLSLQKDMIDEGLDPKHFFSSVRAYGLDPKPRLEALRRGEVDAVTLNVCWTERQEALGLDPLEGLRPIGLRQNDTKCMASTSLYPNWSFLISPRLDAPTIVKVANSLYSMPAAAGGEKWTLASDFSGADELYRTLRVGPYAYLNDWTLERIWVEYQLPLSLTFLGLGFAVLHYFRTRHMVRVRTRELQEALAEQRRLSQLATDLTQRYERTKHAVEVLELSSMIAHELSQPLGSLLLYAKSLDWLLAGDEGIPKLKVPLVRQAVEKIIGRAQQASEIVALVRSQAKSKTAALEAVDLRKALSTAVAGIAAGTEQGVVSLTLPARPIVVLGSPLELELAAANLIKNGLEAGQGQASPIVDIRVFAEERRAVIKIANKGQQVSDDILARLAEPLSSVKPDGLGFGLSIVKAIVKRHFGSLSFAKRNAGGLEATVSLPLKDCLEGKTHA